MDIETPEETEARNAAHWETLAPDLEALAEQCCNEFFGDRDMFQLLASEREVWRGFARYLWGLGARPSRRERDGGR